MDENLFQLQYKRKRRAVTCFLWPNFSTRTKQCEKIVSLFLSYHMNKLLVSFFLLFPNPLFTWVIWINSSSNPSLPLRRRGGFPPGGERVEFGYCYPWGGREGGIVTPPSFNYLCTPPIGEQPSYWEKWGEAMLELLSQFRQVYMN